MDINKTLQNEEKQDTPWVLPPQNETSYAPRVLGQSARESFTDYANPRAKEIAVYPGQSIQKAIDIIHALDGGTILLKTGSHFPATSLNLYSQVAIRGDELGTTVIDFQGSSNQVIAQGTDPYSTGSISVSYSGMTVTGSGVTNFTASMIGQSILLQELWYEITGITNTASLSIASPYLGGSLTASAYTIASPVSNVVIDGVTIQNSSGVGLYAQYVNNFTIDSSLLESCGTGISYDTSSFIQILNSSVDSCTEGIVVTNTHLGTYFNSNVTNISDIGFAANGMRNWGFEIFSFEGIGGTAITLRNTVNNGFVDYAVQQVTGAGFELISNNTDLSISEGVVNNTSGDGIRLLNANLRASITGNSVINAGGYGINIVNSTNTDNIIYPNTYTNNTLGNTNDAGTRSITGSAISKLRVHKSTAQNISTTPTKIQFDALDYNPSNDYDNVTNYRFTATIAGYYLCNARFYQAVNALTDIYVFIYKNGVSYSRGHGVNGSGINEPTNVSVTDIVPLSVGDYIETFGYNSQGNLAVGTDVDQCFLNVHFLSNL